MKMKNKNFTPPPTRKPTGTTRKTVAKRKDNWQISLNESEE